MRAQPIISGVLGLALLEAALSSTEAAGRVGQLLDGVASVIAHVLSPTVPAIPDLRHKADAGATIPASATVPADWTTSASALYA